MHFSSRSLRRSVHLVVVIAGAGGLGIDLIVPASAQQIIPGPLKVTDSGPSGPAPYGYAIKGITSYSGPSYSLIVAGGRPAHHPFHHPHPWSGPAPEPLPYAGHPYVGRHP